MSNILPRVMVFMSTYNGKKYICEQLDSILHQNAVNIYLWIRDDGSQDGTQKIIEKYMKNNQNIAFIQGNNIGFEHSFAEVSRISADADYFAFSDQDDVWDPDKLITAVTALHGIDEAALYASNIEIVDSKLNIIKTLYNKEEADKCIDVVKKYSVLGENAYGCTMVWNKELQLMLCKHKPIVKASQDVYTQMLNDLIGGTYIYDPVPRIKHRIHENNTAGIEKKSLYRRIRKGFRVYIFSDISPKFQIAQEIMNYYSKDIKFKNETQKNLYGLLTQYPTSIRAKGKLLSADYLKSKSFQRRVFTRLLILLNRY